LQNVFTRQTGARLPLIGGAMYPCSNPELVAAVSAAGGLGVLQPISLTYVYGYEFRAGLRHIRSLTDAPVGMNVILESSSRLYVERMRRYVDEALEEGVRFFVSSLGNPRWLAERVHADGGVLYHDVTERKWGLKARDGGVDGLIAVNARAGGHAGERSPEALLEELHDLGLPVAAAGGVGDGHAFAEMLALGYHAVQIGTRLIATEECQVDPAYKQAIVRAREDDVVLTERVTGVPLAVINTPHVQRIGTRAGPLARRLLRHRRTKHWMRGWYSVRSAMRLKKAVRGEGSSADYWQAGRSVGGIDAVEPVAAIVSRFEAAARARLEGAR
jgi:nitronate monooxygenase